MTWRSRKENEVDDDDDDHEDSSLSSRVQMKKEKKLTIKTIPEKLTFFPQYWQGPNGLIPKWIRICCDR